MFHLTRTAATEKKLRVHAKHNQAKSCQQHAKQAKSSKIMSCKNHAKIVQNELLVLSFFSANPCEKGYSPRPCGQVTRGECVARQKKKLPVKKEWQVGQDNDSRSRRPGLARGRMERRAEPDRGPTRCSCARTSRPGRASTTPSIWACGGEHRPKLG